MTRVMDPLYLASTGFEVVVYYMSPLFGRAHGCLDFILNFNKKKLMNHTWSMTNFPKQI